MKKEDMNEIIKELKTKEATENRYFADVTNELIYAVKRLRSDFFQSTNDLPQRKKELYFYNVLTAFFSKLNQITINYNFNEILTPEKLDEIGNEIKNQYINPCISTELINQRINQVKSNKKH